MKAFLLAAATLSLITNMEAREHWGPPSACPQPKADCCPKPKPCAKPAPKPCAKPAPKSAPQPSAKPQASKPKACPPPCDPCCPPVCFERGYPTECCIPAASVEPANIHLRCGLDIFGTLSFTYWQVMQGGMDLALPGQSSTITQPIPIGQVTLPATGHHVLYQEQSFKPGFQIGFGWSGCKDGWTLYGEYSWVRGTTHTSADAPSPGVSEINGVSVGAFGVWVPTSWLPGVYNANISTSISSKWKYGLDIADLQLSRPSYIGTRFVLEPLFGFRGLWIRQSLNIEANTFASTDVSAGERTAHYKSHSWAVGPRAGFNGKWLLGYGLRFIGDSSLSLLYTQYDVSQEVGAPELGALPLHVKLDDYNALRPNLDLSLGFGWGSYLYCRRFHLDFALTYDFSVFWQQNMMRYLADLTADLTAHPDGSPSSLYLQGLTLKAEFEF